MIVTSNTDKAKWAMFLFLHSHGVELARSEDFQAVGRLNAAGKLIAVVGYNGFSGRMCCMHVAGDGNWINRELLFMAFHYPFVQADMVELTALVAGDNARALRLDKRLGFTERYIIPDGWCPLVDLHVLSMRRQDCRWINGAEKYEYLKVA